MCKAPVTIFRNKKRDLVPCGKCVLCLAKKRADWSFRLLQEMAVSSSAIFLTLTYENEPEQGLEKRDLQLFLKKLRKVNSGKIRYYAVGEYGTRTHRAHYHLIMYNIDAACQIQNVWSQGHIKVGSVTAASIHYVTKYCITGQSCTPQGRNKPFALMSRRPGIGINYLSEPMMKWHREDDRMYVINNGYKQAIPRYYRDKVFSPFERSLIQFTASHESERAYIEEIQRLIKLGHRDPYRYYADRARINNDLQMARLIKSDKF